MVAEKLTRGAYGSTSGPWRKEPEFWYVHTRGNDPHDRGHPSYPVIRSRQDCDDLIALLQRVRERLPDGR